jgi:hypothetical protein
MALTPGLSVGLKSKAGRLGKPWGDIGGLVGLEGIVEDSFYLSLPDISSLTLR